MEGNWVDSACDFLTQWLTLEPAERQGMGTEFLDNEMMMRDLLGRDGGACSWKIGGQDLFEGSGLFHGFLHHPDIQSSTSWL